MKNPKPVVPNKLGKEAKPPPSPTPVPPEALKPKGPIMNKTTVVDVKSSWSSKINWTQAIAFVAMVLAYFGIDLDATTQAAVLAGIVAAQAVVTWILRTFFTSTVTAASLPAK